jgi:hypothetical protein
MRLLDLEHMRVLTERLPHLRLVAEDAIYRPAIRDEFQALVVDEAFGLDRGERSALREAVPVGVFQLQLIFRFLDLLGEECVLVEAAAAKLPVVERDVDGMLELLHADRLPALDDAELELLPFLRRLEALDDEGVRRADAVLGGVAARAGLAGLRLGAATFALTSALSFAALSPEASLRQDRVPTRARVRG